MKYVCIIPARYASTRLPGKPLAEISGHPMIEWVYKRAHAANIFNKIIVATDDQRIEKKVKQFSGEVYMTPVDLPSGTDRVAWVAQNIDADIFINIQGDEPLIDIQLLKEVCGSFNDPEIEMVTAAKKIREENELHNYAVVKLVLNKNNKALYFSRLPIPFLRDSKKAEDWCVQHDFFKHIGIYAYRKKTLLKLWQLPQAKLEVAEKLEQLRALEYGFKIHVIRTNYDNMSVDTAEDLKKINEYVLEKNLKMDVSNATM